MWVLEVLFMNCFCWWFIKASCEYLWIQRSLGRYTDSKGKARFVGTSGLSQSQTFGCFSWLAFVVTLVSEKVKAFDDSQPSLFSQHFGPGPTLEDSPPNFWMLMNCTLAVAIGETWDSNRSWTSSWQSCNSSNGWRWGTLGKMPTCWSCWIISWLRRNSGPF